MGSANTRRWLPLLILAVVALAIGYNVIWAGKGDVFDLLLFGVMAVIVWWAWPGRKGKHTDHAAIQADADGDDIIVYWRPG